MKPGGIVANPFGEISDTVRMNPPRGKGLLEKPAGPIDPEVSFISVRTKDGRPIALLANYSLHYVGGVPAGGVSSDYFGEFANQIQKRNAPEKVTATRRLWESSPMAPASTSTISTSEIRSLGKNPSSRSVMSPPTWPIRSLKPTSRPNIGTRPPWLWLSGIDAEYPTAHRRATGPRQKFLAETDDSKLPPRAKAYANFACICRRENQRRRSSCRRFALACGDRINSLRKSSRKSDWKSKKRAR